jgi:hypothetical protein
MSVYSVFVVGKPDGKYAREMSRRRWQANSKIDLKEVGWEGG